MVWQHARGGGPPTSLKCPSEAARGRLGTLPQRRNARWSSSASTRGTACGGDVDQQVRSRRSRQRSQVVPVRLRHAPHQA